MVNWDRYTNHFSTTLTRAAVSGDGYHPRSIPASPSIRCDATNPVWRICPGQIVILVKTTATYRAKISFVTTDTRIPRLSIKSLTALFAFQFQRLYPFWVDGTANVFRFKPRGIVFRWFAYAIHTLGILCAKATARAKPLTRHSTGRYQHERSAFLTWLLLPHVFAHGEIIARFGSGTTGQVAQALGRNWIGCEINREYERLQRQRTVQMGMVL